MQSALPCASLRGPDRDRPRTPAHRSQNAGRWTSRSSIRNFFPAGATLFKMRRHVDSVGRIKPDLVAQGADRYPEHARRAGAVAVATREGLQHELALDLADGRTDQQRHDLVRSQRQRRSFRRMDRGLNNRLSNEYLNRLLYGFLGHQLLPIQRPPRIVEAETSRTNNYPVATVVRVG